jgi:hypothetical protein
MPGGAGFPVDPRRAANRHWRFRFTTRLDIPPDFPQLHIYLQGRLAVLPE